MCEMRWSEEQQTMIEDVRNYFNKHKKLRIVDFLGKNGLKPYRRYQTVFKLKGLFDLYEIAGLDVNEDYKRAHFSKRKGISDSELLNVLREYYEKHGVAPKTRDFTAEKGFPNARVYFERFGSFGKALELANVKVEDERKWLYGRKVWTKEEVVEVMERFVCEYVQKNRFLPTYQTMEDNCLLPSATARMKFFASNNELFEHLGYDKNHNYNAFKDILHDEFIDVYRIIQRTPTSRDLDAYSKKGVCSSASTYIDYFGDICTLHRSMGCESTISPHKNKTNEELLEDVDKLYKSLGRVPLQRDCSSVNNVATSETYIKRFGSFRQALIEAGIPSSEINSNFLVTEGGVECLSYYEYDFATMLEGKGIPFQKEVLYKKIIPELDKLFRFDFEVEFENVLYYVEIFGVTGLVEYDKRTDEKISLCDNNKIPLIRLFPKDMINKTHEDLFQNMLKQIKKYRKEGERDSKKNCI